MVEGQDFHPIGQDQKMVANMVRIVVRLKRGCLSEVLFNLLTKLQMIEDNARRFRK